MAIQYHVLVACGLDISPANLVHLNRQNRDNGQQYDPRKLTKRITTLDSKLPALLRAQRKTLAQDVAPEVDPPRAASALIRHMDSARLTNLRVGRDAAGGLIGRGDFTE